MQLTVQKKILHNVKKLVICCYMNKEKENNTLRQCKNTTYGVVFLYMWFCDANILQLIPFLFWKTVLSPNQTSGRSACLAQTSHTHGFYKNMKIISIDTWVNKVQFDMETDSLDINASCDSILSRSVPQFMQSNKNSNMLINKTNLCTYPTAKAAIYKDINYSKN